MTFFANRAYMAAVALLLSAAAVHAKVPDIDPTYGLPLPPAPAHAPAPPTASWVWASNADANQTVYLRRAFALTAAPTSAVLWITADNSFIVYINGHQVDTSEPDVAVANNWQNVHSKDVTAYLTTGKNVIAVQAKNIDGPAGVAARLAISGLGPIETGKDWKVSAKASAGDSWTKADFDDAEWSAATVEARIDGGVWGDNGGVQGWPGYDTSAPYMAHVTLPVVKVMDIHRGGGTIAGAESLAGKLDGAVTVTTAGSATEAPSFVLDFGRELAGRVTIDALTDGEVSVGTGESYEEATKSPWHGEHKVVLATGKPGVTPYSAFRYAKVSFPASAAGPRTIKLRIAFDHKYYPVQYLGSFDCSDDRLTRIWYTGAYTAHLCMQEDIWDAPKRDRARWIGDLHVSGNVIDTVFADKFLMEQTLDRLRADAQRGKPDTEPPSDEINDIPGYSAAYICTLADFHRHVGDYAYLNRHHEELLSLLDYMRGNFDDRGVFVNKHGKWPFTDWSPGFESDTPQARASTHLFITKAVKEALFLLREMDDSANAAKYDQWLTQLNAAGRKYLPDNATGTYGTRLQENAMAIYSGVATPAQMSSIYDRVLKPGSNAWNKTTTPAYNEGVFSPYYGNYIINAMSIAGHNPQALGLIRSYWGGMLDEGATSFWEAYDPLWSKTDFHANLYADNGQGYFVSLCHGWSAGPTTWLTERVLGVQPTSGGFKTADVTPDLCDLRWVEGDVPTPYGALHVRTERKGKGLMVQLIVPKGITLKVRLAGNSMTLNNKAVPTEIGEDGRRIVEIGIPGIYKVISNL